MHKKLWTEAEMDSSAVDIACQGRMLPCLQWRLYIEALSNGQIKASDWTRDLYERGEL